MTNLGSITIKKHSNGVISCLEDYDSGVVKNMTELNKEGQITREMRENKHLLYQMSTAKNPNKLYDKTLRYILTKV